MIKQSKISLRKGVKNDLPTNAPLGEPLFCMDTGEMYVGMGEDSPLKQVVDTEVKSQLEDIVPYYISNNFFELPNIQQRLETLLNDKTIQNVVFPFGILITLEKQLIIKRNDLTVDYNFCTFQFLDGYSATPRYDFGTSVGCNIISYLDSTNIKIKNLKIEGKRLKYNGTDTTNDKWQTGLFLSNIKNFNCSGFYASNVNYHAIVTYNTINTFFENLYFDNNGLCGGNGGYSDVYTSDDGVMQSDVTFVNTFATRTDLLTVNTGQIFYINNQKSFIQNIKGKNIYMPFDYRKGSHVVRDVNIDGGGFLATGAYPVSTEFPTISMENITLTNLIGSGAGGAMFYITACSGLNVKNIKLSSTNDYSYLYGISIKKDATGAPINNLDNIFFDGVIINITGNNTRAISIDSMVKDVIFNNVVINAYGQPFNAIRTTRNISNVIVNNVSINGNFVINYEGVDGKLIIINKPIINNTSPTTKPDFIGQEYIDTVNKKIYRAFGISSVSDWSSLN